ncbi:MAG: tRNA(His) guanylyltransferase Thg1 family protein [Ruminococcus sp.]|nr:tRNA(His) guanylyltransferase Thg1 family protein [Ruminococcus sp.]
MPVHDDLGTRMKEYYESVPKIKLVRRMPVAIRIDGKAFHTFTRGFNKPFDNILIASMQDTMKYLCENIQGCVLGYTQSDEITLILIDYQNLNTSAWFDYEVQKICSISASMATLAFNRNFSHRVFEQLDEISYPTFKNMPKEEQEKFTKYRQTLFAAEDRGAMFDARCFNIPKEEVTNLVYWRQLDAIRNSVQMVGQTNFSHKELQNKTCNMIKEMLATEKGIVWEELPIHYQRGSCCIKATDDWERGPRWQIDKNIPIFKEEGRDYIDKLVCL